MKRFFFYTCFFLISGYCSCQGITDTGFWVRDTHNTTDTSRKPISKPEVQSIGSLHDLANLFTATERRQLDSAMSAFNKTTGLTITIVTIDSSMASSDGVDYFTRKFGTDKKINTTIGIAPYYKKMHIWNDSLVNNTVLREYETKEIIENSFIPDFKSGKYYDGTLKGVKAIRNTIERKLKVNFE